MQDLRKPHWVEVHSHQKGHVTAEVLGADSVCAAAHDPRPRGRRGPRQGGAVLVSRRGTAGLLSCLLRNPAAAAAVNPGQKARREGQPLRPMALKT